MNDLVPMGVAGEEQGNRITSRFPAGRTEQMRDETHLNLALIEASLFVN